MHSKPAAQAAGFFQAEAGAPRLPLIGEALGYADPKPPLPGEVARRNAETERLYRKETTSQSASQTAPLKGEPLGMRPIFAEKAVRALVKGERM